MQQNSSSTQQYFSSIYVRSHQDNYNQVNFKFISLIGTSILIAIIIQLVLATLAFLFNQDFGQESINMALKIKELNYAFMSNFLISIPTIIFFKQFVNQIKLTNEQWSSFLLRNNINYTITTKSFFISYFSQGTFYPLRYCCLYYSLALIFLVQKFLPEELWVCYNNENGNFKIIRNYSEELNESQDCIIKHQSALFEGEILKILGYYSLLISVLLLIIQLFIFLLQMIQLKSNQIEMNSQEINSLDFCKLKYQANRFCCYSAIYSLCKAQFLIVISCLTKNESSIFLICSNIYYHIFIFVIMLCAANTIDQNVNTEDFDVKKNCFKNYMVLFDSLVCSYKRKNLILQILIISSLSLTLIGRIFFRYPQVNEQIINHDYFIEFDCFFFQITVLAFISVKYLFCSQCFQIQLYNQNFQESFSEIPNIKLESSQTNDTAIRETSEKSGNLNSEKNF